MCGYLVFIKSGHNNGMESWPQKQLLHKQVLHHSLHVAESTGVSLRVVSESLDEARLCVREAVGGITCLSWQQKT